MIVNYFEPAANFELPPEKAIQYFTSKGLKASYNWYEMLNAEHDKAFTVAKMMDLDLLATVRAELDKALTEGLTLDDFKKNLIPTLQAKGWWGKKDIIDPATGHVTKVQLGSASRLETIFRTNLQSSYAAGHWESIVEGKDSMPYLMYDAVDDSRTRAEHAQFDGTVLPVEHPFWQTNYPPNGWNCRCGVIQMDADDLEEYGLTVSDGPFNQTKKWTNPDTGETVKVPVGTDPGFAHNPGFGLLEHLKQTQAKKINKMPPDAQQAAQKGVKATNDSAQSKKDAQKAIQEVSDIDGETLAKATEHAKEQLSLIAQGKATKQAKLKQQTLNKAQKSGLADDLTPVQLLAHVVTTAAKEQAKKEKASALTGYKKKVLAGKLPTKKQQEVFDKLTDDEKAKVLADIDKKQKEKQAEETLPSTPGTTLSMANMKQIGGQGGSNPGGTYYDETTGAKWYIKEPVSDSIARNEHLANEFYRAAGIEVPETQIIVQDGKTLLASRIIDDVTENREALRKGSVKGVQDSFVVDAWLANWDVVGLVFDNMLVKNGRAIRLDNGGALLYRAQGSRKGAAFGDEVGELDTLRDPDLNASAAATFKHATREDLIAGARKVLAFTDEDIERLVKEHGPLEPDDQKLLIKTLIARREDIRRKFPEADNKTPAAEPPDGRVKPAELKAIKNSRVNGYSLLTDKDQIENHNVIVNHYTDKNGEQRTKMWLRVNETHLDKFDDQVRGDLKGGGEAYDASGLYEAELTFARGYNKQADIGEGWRDKDIERLDTLIELLESNEKKLKAIKTDEARAQRKHLKDSLDEAKQLRSQAAAGKPITKKWRNVAPESYKPITKSGSGRWVERKQGYTIAQFDKANATEINDQRQFNEAEHWYVDDRDGITTRYLGKKGNGRAARGHIEMTTKGTDADAVERLFRRLDEYNINTDRAKKADRELLYLNKIAKGTLVRDPKKWEKYRKLKTLKAKREMLVKEVGWDFTKSPHYNPSGFRQAFDHGRVLTRRPDIKDEEWEPFAKDFRVYHNPLSLGDDFFDRGIGEVVMSIVRGGGQMASMMDRFRRGVIAREESANSDIGTGGGNYVFTRIRHKRNMKKAGFWWKADPLLRSDVIAYDHDAFGRTATHYQRQRRKWTVDEFRQAAKRPSNEAIFKDGLSLFDALDRIVLPTQEEAEWLIAELKKEGYNTWPDGRKLTDVIRHKGSG